MAWRCPVCGTDNEETTARCIGCCSYARVAASLVLTSVANGRSLRMNVNTSLGRSVLLGRVEDPEANYASEPQFDVIRDTSVGAWLLRHCPGARNPTFYNGAAVGVETPPLRTGGVISIGPERMKLTVSLEG